MQINLTYLLVALIAFLAALALKYGVPYIKSKMSIERRQSLLFWAKLAVQAAEQLIKGSGLGSDKKSYVLDFLREKGFDINEKEVDVAIESAVLELKNAILE